jgi:WhiB family redox-sensing transcriptional regulator
MNDLQKTLAAVKDAMSWMHEANCKKMDADLFFPTEKGGGYSEFAKEVCATCPVVEPCLWYANETSAETGMFGGMSPPQRLAWRRKNKVTMGMSKHAWKNRYRGYLSKPTSEWSKL